MAIPDLKLAPEHFTRTGTRTLHCRSYSHKPNRTGVAIYSPLVFGCGWDPDGHPEKEVPARTPAGISVRAFGKAAASSRRQQSRVMLSYRRSSWGSARRAPGCRVRQTWLVGKGGCPEVYARASASLRNFRLCLCHPPGRESFSAARHEPLQIRPHGLNLRKDPLNE
jgi:hypothetical protein